MGYGRLGEAGITEPQETVSGSVGTSEAVSNGGW